MENINEALEDVPKHLLKRETPTKKSVQAEILYIRDKFGGIKFYDQRTLKMGYRGPVAVQESINKAHEKYK